LDEEASEFVAKSTFDHPYPTTKIMWIPDTKGIYPDLLATSGGATILSLLLFPTNIYKGFILDYLRVWRAGETHTTVECLLNNNKNSDFCAPLTSFDWNEVDPNLLGTSSIDTTCTIWYFKTFLYFCLKNSLCLQLFFTTLIVQILGVLKQARFLVDWIRWLGMWKHN